MADRLGILVNSDRYAEYLVPLIRAARDRQKRVHLHFAGAGLALAEPPVLKGLSGLARISIPIGAGGEAGRWERIARMELAEFLGSCDRVLVF